MTFDDYISTLRLENDRFATTIAAVLPETIIPTCPQWTMGELTLHLGQVQRWARFSVMHPGIKPPKDFGAPPDNAGLQDWFRDGSTALEEALTTADPSGDYYTFLANPPAPLTFWARRQAHEVAMHRVDAQISLGMVDALSPEMAADGLDELLTGFVPRTHMKLRSQQIVTMAVLPTDVDDQWQLTISNDPVATTRTATDESDCTVRGMAGDLLMALWNRTTKESLDVSGRADILGLFCDSIQIR